MTYKTKNWKRKNNKDKKDTLYKTACCKQSHWQSLLQSTQNTKDMTIHSDISEIIGQCRHDLTLEASFTPEGGGRYSINFYTGRLLPDVRLLTLLYTIFHEKDSFFGQRLSATVPVQAIIGSTPPGEFQTITISYSQAHTSCPLQFIVFVGKTICILKKKENHHSNNLFEILN